MADMLTVTRGDTLPLKIDITSDGEAYTMASGDVLLFSIKKTTDVDDEVLVQKEMDSETGPECELTPDDTDLDYGKYWYDAELTMADGRRFTVVKPSRMQVTREVTTHGND